MDNTKVKENLKYLNDFLNKVGFDQKIIDEDFSRLFKIIFVHVMQKLEPLIPADKPIPKMESIHDFYKFYGSFMDKTLIDKILQEETNKTISGYLNTILEQLPK